MPVIQINEFVKRARQAKIHAYIIGQLKKDMPAMMGKNKAQKKLIDNLEDEFAKVRPKGILVWARLNAPLLLLRQFDIRIGVGRQQQRFGMIVREI